MHDTIHIYVYITSDLLAHKGSLRDVEEGPYPPATPTRTENLQPTSAQYKQYL